MTKRRSTGNPGAHKSRLRTAKHPNVLSRVLLASPDPMTTNPYSPPKIASTSNESYRPEIPLGWNICFWILVVGVAVDLGIIASRLTVGSLGGMPTSMVVLALIALAQVLMVFAIRWILFRLILRRRMTGHLHGLVPLGGVIVIFAMVKLIEFQGFRLWSGTGDLGRFLVFLLPSLVLVVFMSPRRLAQFQACGPHRKAGPPDSVVIRS